MQLSTRTLQELIRRLVNLLRLTTFAITLAMSPPILSRRGTIRTNFPIDLFSQESITIWEIDAKDRVNAQIVFG